MASIVCSTESARCMVARATSPFSPTKAVIAWCSVRRASIAVISSSRATAPSGGPES